MGIIAGNLDCVAWNQQKLQTNLLTRASQTSTNVIRSLVIHG